jgi:hypothetical protein
MPWRTVTLKQRSIVVITLRVMEAHHAERDDYGS